MKARFGYVLGNLSIDYAKRMVEEAGFDSIWLYDHFMHWSHKDGVRNPELCMMTLAVMPIVLDRTSCPVGASVIAPILRYHPAIVAQYFAQLDYLYPNRVILGVGTGEAMNEIPTVGFFPPIRERRERLREAVDIIRRLWESQDYIDYSGRFYQLKNAMLFLKPKGKIPIIVSAGGPKAAALAGEIGDGVMFINVSPQRIRDELLPSFESAAESAGKNPEEMPKMFWTIGGVIPPEILPKAVRALRRAAPWVHPKAFSEYDPRKIDQLAEEIAPEQLTEAHPFVSSVEELVEHFASYIDVGINYIVFFDVTPLFERDAKKIIEMWSSKIFPHLKV